MPLSLLRTVASILIGVIAHNSIAVFYIATNVLFFSPFNAMADALSDGAALGIGLANQQLQAYKPSTVDSKTGAIVMNNGAVAGQTITTNQLAQEVQPGVLDAAAAAYGNAPQQSKNVSQEVNRSANGTTQHDLAYQTLIKSYKPIPDMTNDPIFKTSDEVFSLKSPLMTDLLSGCEKTTDYTAQKCGNKISDYRTCTKTLKGQTCNVERILTSAPYTGEVIRLHSYSGPGGASVQNCGAGCTQISLGSGTIWNKKSCGVYNLTGYFEILRPDLITAAKLTIAEADDHDQVYMNNDLVFTGHTGWSCGETSRMNTDTPNLDVTSYFQNGGIVAFREQIAVVDGGGGDATITIYAHQVTDSFTDSPVGCRARLMSVWPPVNTNPPGFTSSGSLNDQASTDWWQCNNAVTSIDVGPVSKPVSIVGSSLSPILPNPPATPPAPLCMSASLRTNGSVSAPCTTDYQGYVHCPTYKHTDLLSEHTTCDTLTANPACQFISENCVKDSNGMDLVDPITGQCRQFVVTYNCGTTTPANCATQTSQQTICDSPIRCIGGECVDPEQESNDGFIQAAVALQVLNQAQQYSKCSGTDCQIFEGKSYECQVADLSILGSVDCCNMPLNVNWINYLQLTSATWKLADSSVQLASLDAYGTTATALEGAWTTLNRGNALGDTLMSLNDQYVEATSALSSGFDSMMAEVLGKDTAQALSEGVSDFSIQAIQDTVTKNVAQWTIDTFGQQAADQLFTTTVDQVSGEVLSATMSESLAMVLNVVGIIYAIYQIAKMVVQMIFACTSNEIQFNMLKSQQLCTREEEIGSYCSTKSLFGCIAVKEVYCCFQSPFARIFQEQARPQLGINFGTPKAPSCGGLSINQIKKLNFKTMDFSEWVGMLSTANMLPTTISQANSLYNLESATSTKMVNTVGPNALDTTRSRTQNLNGDAIRQYLLNNLQ